MTDNFDNIAEIKGITRRDFKRWTIWEDMGVKDITTGKHLKKIRLPTGAHLPAPDPITGEKYKLTENCVSFAESIEVCRKYPGKYYPAFYFIKEDGLIVLDADNVSNPPDFPTYTEKSISPHSFHMMGWYDKKKPVPTIKGIEETYVGPHWVFMTGDCLPGKNTVNDMNSFLEPLITSVKDKSKPEVFKLQTTEKYKTGDRYNTIMSHVRSEKWRGVPLDAIMASAQAINKNHFEPPHKESYIVEIVNKFWNMGDKPEFKEAMEKKKQEEEELKLVDTSGIMSQMKKLNDESWVNGMKVGPEISYNGDDGDNDAKPKITVPAHLLKVPGVLQHVVDYYNSTSIKDQPQFAVTAALAYGSMVTQRRYRTDQNNYTSMFNINVGETSCGKERLKSAIEEIAFAAEVHSLIGPSGYTSAGGVFTALYKNPAHLTIIDELGRQMESEKKDKSPNAETAQTTMMELFGRNNGKQGAKGYSDMVNLSKQQALIEKKQEEEEEKAKTKKNSKYNIIDTPKEELYILHPALSILAMTTPDNFYGSISASLIRDGFLPRFIVVETEYGRPLSKKIKNVNVDKALINWTKKYVKNRAKMIVGGTPQDKEFDPKYAPEPILIPFDISCDDILKNYEIEINKKMDEVGELADLYGKTHEIVMKLSLLIALSCEAEKILPEHVNWSIDYITYYTDKLVDRLRYSLSNSKFEAVCNDLLRIIKKRGTKGLALAEIHSVSRKSREYTAYQIKNQIIPTLEQYHGVKYCPITKPGVSKTKRYALVTKEIAKSFKKGSDEVEDEEFNQQ